MRQRTAQEQTGARQHGLHQNGECTILVQMTAGLVLYCGAMNVNDYRLRFGYHFIVGIDYLNHKPVLTTIRPGYGCSGFDAIVQQTQSMAFLQSRLHRVFDGQGLGVVNICLIHRRSNRQLVR